MWSQKMRQGCAKQPTRDDSPSRGDALRAWWLNSASLPVPEILPFTSRRTPGGRAVIDRQTIHIHDFRRRTRNRVSGELESSAGFGTRTDLAAPLLREGMAIGGIHIRRTEVRPFTDKQIALLETFADQAVIAIENVRLFKEFQERNAIARGPGASDGHEPRFSASSAARRPTCSLCSTPSSRAPRGFVGSMTCCCVFA